MNEKLKELYDFIKSQNATDLSIEDFASAYGNDPAKAKDVFDYVVDQEMTDLNESDFFDAYFGDVKKKDEVSDQFVSDVGSKSQENSLESTSKLEEFNMDLASELQERGRTLGVQEKAPGEILLSDNSKAGNTLKDLDNSIRSRRSDYDKMIDNMSVPKDSDIILEEIESL